AATAWLGTARSSTQGRSGAGLEHLLELAPLDFVIARGVDALDDLARPDLARERVADPGIREDADQLGLADRAVLVGVVGLEGGLVVAAELVIDELADLLLELFFVLVLG